MPVTSASENCWPDCKPEGPLFSAEFVCLCVSVCVWPALLPFNVDRFWWNLVTRTLLWFSLAATIMVQIGRRGTARRLFENLKNSQKSQFKFQNSGPSFFASVSPVYCKRYDSIRTKLTKETDFEICHSGNPPPRRSNGMRSLEAQCSTSVQQQSTSSTGVQRSKLGGHSELGAFGTVGIRNWGRNRAVRTNRLVIMNLLKFHHGHNFV